MIVRVRDHIGSIYQHQVELATEIIQPNSVFAIAIGKPRKVVAVDDDTACMYLAPSLRPPPHVVCVCVCLFV